MMRCIQSSASRRWVSIQAQDFRMSIQATLQPSVKESLWHLIMQRGKLCHSKSSILLISTGQGWLRGPGSEDHIGKDEKKKPVRDIGLGHAVCLCGLLSHGPKNHQSMLLPGHSVRMQQECHCHTHTGVLSPIYMFSCPDRSLVGKNL